MNERRQYSYKNQTQQEKDADELLVFIKILYRNPWGAPVEEKARTA